MHQPVSDFETPEQIEAALRAFVIRWRWRTLLSRMLEASAILLGGLLIVALIHHVLALPSLLREMLCDTLLGAALTRLLPAVARLLSAPKNLVQAAVRIERCQPALQQKLSTWMSGRVRQDRSALFARLQRSLQLQLRTEQIDSALPRWPMVWIATVLGIVLTIALLSWRMERFIGPTLPPWQ